MPQRDRKAPAEGPEGAERSSKASSLCSPDPSAAQDFPEEWPRLSSLCAREGEAAAADFCRRTMAIYRHALLAHRRGSPHASYATLPEYRSRFIRSYCEFKRFARRHAAV